MKYLNQLVIANPDKCVGCRICEVACSIVHADEEETPLTVGSMKNPVQPRLHLVRTAEVTAPIQCKHCEDAPCANSCPAGAISQADNSIILDEELCTGCKNCLLACPFGAIELKPVYHNGEPEYQLCQEEKNNELVNKQRFAATKCDLCAPFAEPACVANCPHDALTFVVPELHRKQRNYQAARNLSAIFSCA